MIEKSAYLVCAPERAFALFTERASDWWPEALRHTGDPHSEIRMLADGRFWEHATDGREVELGRVIVWESERALKVPVSALFRRGDGSAAYVVRGGRAILVPVEAGRSSGSEVQILQGLDEGDEVILYPGDRITEGQRVQAMKM